MDELICIDPAVVTPERPCFEAIKVKSNLPVSYHLPVLEGFASLAGKIRPRGVIVLGSKASPNDASSWRDELIELLEGYISKNVPVLGICYGHQLIAKMFGAKVEFFPDSYYRRGLARIQFSGDKRLSLASGEETVVVTHREIVTTMPKGFALLATSPEVAIDGLKHEAKPIWTMQAHPEAEKSFCLARDINPTPVDLAFGNKLMQAFLDFCAKTAK